MKKQVKKELAEAAMQGIRAYMQSTRGANFLGSGCEIQSAGLPIGTFMIRCPHALNMGGASVYFEVKVTEKL